MSKFICLGYTHMKWSVRGSRGMEKMKIGSRERKMLNSDLWQYEDWGGWGERKKEVGISTRLKGWRKCCNRKEWWWRGEEGGNWKQRRRERRFEGRKGGREEEWKEEWGVCGIMALISGSNWYDDTHRDLQINRARGQRSRGPWWAWSRKVGVEGPGSGCRRSSCCDGPVLSLIFFRSISQNVCDDCRSIRFYHKYFVLTQPQYKLMCFADSVYWCGNVN